ncbi:MAG: hypothetical protein IMX03_07415 [Brockia lithotrophica]|nr:hypothetical protein [Brockia lithotrophica]
MKFDDIFQYNNEIERFFDQLEEIVEKNDTYLLDILPKTADDPDKYKQFELVWEHIVRDKNFPKQNNFLVEEIKFINFFKKLWLYNKVKVYIYEFSRSKSNFLKLANTKEEFYYWAKNNAGKTIFDLSIDKLELLISMGIRDIISSIFVYEDIEIIFWSTGGLAWLVYFNRQDNIEFIKNMAIVEGLYLYFRK